MSEERGLRKTRIGVVVSDKMDKTCVIQIKTRVRHPLYGKIMNQNMKAFIRYLIVAICSAIVTFLSSSCTAGLVIGKNQRQHQENNISTKVDSTYCVPTITIR